MPDVSELETIIRYELSDNSEEIFAHYAEKDKITEAYVNGTPVIALCGKIWIPSRDPEKFPLCPRCDETLRLLLLILDQA